MSAYIDRKGCIDPDDRFAIETYVGEDEPVLAALTYATKYRPAITGGLPENCHPEEGGDVEWELFTTDGKPAPAFLLDMMSAEDEDRITNELLAHCDELAAQAAIDAAEYRMEYYR